MMTRHLITTFTSHFTAQAFATNAAELYHVKIEADGTPYSAPDTTFGVFYVIDDTAAYGPWHRPLIIALRAMAYGWKHKYLTLDGQVKLANEHENDATCGALEPEDVMGHSSGARCNKKNDHAGQHYYTPQPRPRFG